MSMNLILGTGENNKAANWTAVTAIAKHGIVYISDAAVTVIANLLDDAKLSNGEVVTSYFWENKQMEDCVNAFGPSLLSADTLATMDAALAAFPQAQEMLRLVTSLGLRVSLTGTTHHGAHLTAVNWVADEVEINRSNSGMRQMIEALGLDTCWNGSAFGEVDFATFSKAVNDNGHKTGYPVKRLEAFIESGRRQNAHSVYWG